MLIFQPPGDLPHEPKREPLGRTFGSIFFCFVFVFFSLGPEPATPSPRTYHIHSGFPIVCHGEEAERKDWMASWANGFVEEAFSRKWVGRQALPCADNVRPAGGLHWKEM